MQITSGCGKGGFAPGLIAGTTRSVGGAFAPFTLTLTRQDGEANPKTLALHLPQGLLAKLGGVPLCSDADAATGDCPAGSSESAPSPPPAGVGGAPLVDPPARQGPTAVYLAGPYKGAPYSIVAVVPAQAGPFDLGTVVTRAAINVDPNTALATITTDPLPQILEGVPVLYRTIHVDVDRPEFTLNPTSCEAKADQRHGHRRKRSGTLNPPPASRPPTAPNSATAPKLKLSFKGATKRSGNPAVKAVLTQPANQANTAGATVILPSSEFIDQSHINNPCTRVQFNENACPAKLDPRHRQERSRRSSISPWKARSTSAATAANGNSPTSSPTCMARSTSPWSASSTRCRRRAPKSQGSGPASKTSPTPP